MDAGRIGVKELAELLGNEWSVYSDNGAIVLMHDTTGLHVLVAPLIVLSPSEAKSMCEALQEKAKQPKCGGLHMVEFSSVVKATITKSDRPDSANQDLTLEG